MRPRRQRGAQRKRQREIDRCGRQPLDRGDPAGIGQRHLARQVVVQGPAQASPQHGKRGPHAGKARFARPAEDERTRDDQDHAPSHAAIHVFAERKPRQQRREHALGIQQQRGARCGHACQSQHQQHGSRYAPASDCRRQPGHFGARQMHFGRTRQPPVQPQPQAGAQVKQASQQPGVDRMQQELGQRRAGAKQQRSDQRRRHPRLPKRGAPTWRVCAKTGHIDSFSMRR